MISVLGGAVLPSSEACMASTTSGGGLTSVRFTWWWGRVRRAWHGIVMSTQAHGASCVEGTPPPEPPPGPRLEL
jgi:hypothetical protein